MNSITLCLIITAPVAIFYPSDAARFGGGSRFSSSRYSSSRYSYVSSRVSIRSSSYRRYSTRYYSTRTYYAYGAYRTGISEVGMGGLTMNKQSLLIAGSVYVAYSMRPRIYTASGAVISSSVEAYAICSGRVNWNTIYNNGTYVMPDLANGTRTGGNNATDLLAPTNASLTSGVIAYRYFMCPNDLMDSIFDDDDTYCCGPPGYQLCCSREDFYDQSEEISMGLKIAFALGSLVCIGTVVLTIFILYRRCSARRLQTQRAPPTAVIFQPVATSEPQQIQMKFIPQPSPPQAEPTAAPAAAFPSIYPPPPAVNYSGGAPDASWAYQNQNNSGVMQQPPPLPTQPPPSYNGLYN